MKHKILFLLITLVISSLYVFFTGAVEAAAIKPTVAVSASAEKVSESGQVVITAVAITANGNPVDKLTVTLDKQKKTCEKSYYCRVSFGPFTISKNKTLSYTATAVVKAGAKSLSVSQKKSLVVVKDKKKPVAPIVPAEPVVLEQGETPAPVVAPAGSGQNSNSPAASDNAANNQQAPDLTSTRDTKRLSDLRLIQAALELYYADNNAYPDGNDVTLGIGNYACLNSDGWGAEGCPYPYMTVVPQDSLFGYKYSLAGTEYAVDTQLEGTAEGLSGSIRLNPTGIKKN